MSTVKLGDIAIESRDSLKEKDKSLPVVGLEHLIPEQINLTDWNIGQENTFTKTFEKGDVLFGRRRAYLKKAAVAPCKGICSGDITVIRAKEDNILPEILPFVIQNDVFFDFAVGKSAGSLSPRVKWEHLANYEFNLPELEGQKKLAKVLWQIVDTMESYKKLLAKTDEMVKAKFVEMFGLCEHKKLAEITDIVLGQSPDSDTYNDKGDGLPFYQGKTEFGDKYVTPKVYCSTPLKIAKPNDVLLSVRAPVGAVNMTKDKCCIGRGLAALSFKDSKANDFLFYALKVCEADIERMGQGATFKAITGEQVKNIMIPVAEENLKNTFINFFQKSEESKAAIKASLDSLSAVYKKIIAENLGGSN